MQIEIQQLTDGTEFSFNGKLYKIYVVDKFCSTHADYLEERYITGFDKSKRHVVVYPKIGNVYQKNINMFIAYGTVVDVVENIDIIKKTTDKEISHVKIGSGSIIIESKSIKYLTDNVKNKYLYKSIPFAVFNKDENEYQDNDDFLLPISLPENYISYNGKKIIKESKEICRFTLSKNEIQNIVNAIKYMNKIENLHEESGLYISEIAFCNIDNKILEVINEFIPLDYCNRGYNLCIEVPRYQTQTVITISENTLF